MRKKIIVTGGHVTPAVAVIEELMSDNKWDIVFVGRKHAMEGDKAISFEYETITEMGISFRNIVAGRIQRNLTRYSLLSLLKVPVGFIQSIIILFRTKPDGIVSFGGYVAIPVVLAAKVFGVPIITHEQTTSPGLANRIIARLANVVCVSWKNTENYFPKSKTCITGNPLRKEFFDEDIQQPVIENYNKPIIFISGGSLGAHVINRAVVPILQYLLHNFYIIHQCGSSMLTKDYEYLREKRSQLPENLVKRYIVKPYFNVSKMVWLLKNAILVISRSGANTITELAYMGTPSLLIPLPHAGAGEQLGNAKMMEQIGTAYILKQETLTSKRLSKSIIHMVQKRKQYEAHIKEAKALVYPDAAKSIVAVISSTFCSSKNRT